MQPLHPTLLPSGQLQPSQLNLKPWFPVEVFWMQCRFAFCIGHLSSWLFLLLGFPNIDATADI